MRKICRVPLQTKNYRHLMTAGRGRITLSRDQPLYWLSNRNQFIETTKQTQHFVFIYLCIHMGITIIINTRGYQLKSGGWEGLEGSSSEGLEG